MKPKFKMKTVPPLLLKTLTWRLFSVGVTILLVLLVTGSVKSGLSLGALDLLVKTSTYYAHELLWR